MPRTFDLTAGVIAYENHEMEEDETIEFFQFLLDSGVIYHLQGSYQRTAQAMIENGVLKRPS